MAMFLLCLCTLVVKPETKLENLQTYRQKLEKYLSPEYDYQTRHEAHRDIQYLDQEIAKLQHSPGFQGNTVKGKKHPTELHSPAHSDSMTYQALALANKLFRSSASRRLA